MHTNVKVYRTFAEINKELEILKVEKDLAYAKFIKGLDETKVSMQPGNLIGETPMKVLGVLGAFSGPIKSAVLTYLLKKIF